MCIFTTVTFVFNTKIISDGSEFVVNALFGNSDMFQEIRTWTYQILTWIQAGWVTSVLCFEYHSRLARRTKNFISIFWFLRPSPSRRLSSIFQFSSSNLKIEVINLLIIFNFSIGLAWRLGQFSVSWTNERAILIADIHFVLISQFCCWLWSAASAEACCWGRWGLKKNENNELNLTKKI